MVGRRASGLHLSNSSASLRDHVKRAATEPSRSTRRRHDESEGGATNPSGSESSTTGSRRSAKRRKLRRTGTPSTSTRTALARSGRRVPPERSRDVERPVPVQCVGDTEPGTPRQRDRHAGTARTTGSGPPRTRSPTPSRTPEQADLDPRRPVGGSRRPPSRRRRPSSRAASIWNGSQGPIPPDRTPTPRTARCRGSSRTGARTRRPPGPPGRNRPLPPPGRSSSLIEPGEGREHPQDGDGGAGHGAHDGSRGRRRPDGEEADERGDQRRVAGVWPGWGGRTTAARRGRGTRRTQHRVST